MPEINQKIAEASLLLEARQYSGVLKALNDLWDFLEQAETTTCDDLEVKVLQDFIDGILSFLEKFSEFIPIA